MFVAHPEGGKNKEATRDTDAVCQCLRLESTWKPSLPSMVTFSLKRKGWQRLTSVREGMSR